VGRLTALHHLKIYGLIADPHRLKQQPPNVSSEVLLGWKHPMLKTSAPKTWPKRAAAGAEKQPYLLKLRSNYNKICLADSNLRVTTSCCHQRLRVCVASQLPGCAVVPSMMSLVPGVQTARQAR
jgi:hypothetical protein